MKKIDWENLSFGYQKTDYNVRCYYRDGKWGEIEVSSDENINIHMAATCLHYGQEAFEGLKAYRCPDGKVRVFRPEENAARLQRTCRGIVMPEPPTSLFIEMVKKVVRLNQEYIPTYESGATLYIRPLLIGTGAQVGVRPAEEYLLLIFVTPVGPYFKGGTKGIAIKVSDFDRAAPRGTGDIKAGLNYAMSLHPIVVAHNEGYAENLYPDAATRTKVEETGGANFLFVTRDGTIVTPKSGTILPSITRRSLIYVAEQMLGMKVDEREVYLTELDDFVECGLCGTAAVISPVASISDHGREIVFKYGKDEMGPVIKKLYDTLTGIQMGRLPAPEGWIYEVK